MSAGLWPLTPDALPYCAEISVTPNHGGAPVGPPARPAPHSGRQRGFQGTAGSAFPHAGLAFTPLQGQTSQAALIVPQESVTSKG